MVHFSQPDVDAISLITSFNIRAQSGEATLEEVAQFYAKVLSTNGYDVAIGDRRTWENPEAVLVGDAALDHEQLPETVKAFYRGAGILKEDGAPTGARFPDGARGDGGAAPGLDGGEVRETPVADPAPDAGDGGGVPH